MSEHHADFAVAVSQKLWLDTRVPRENGTGDIAGWAIALGWWVDKNLNEDGTPGEPVGTLYLIVDSENDGPPVWVAQGNIIRARIDEPEHNPEGL